MINNEQFSWEFLTNFYVFYMILDKIIKKHINHNFYYNNLCTKYSDIELSKETQVINLIESDLMRKTLE
jgi:uncharacterized membrane protein YobD (UPF0266 family)